MELKYTALEFLNAEISDFIDDTDIITLSKNVKVEERKGSLIGEFENQFLNIQSLIKKYKIQLQSLIALVKYGELHGFTEILCNDRLSLNLVEANDAIENANLNFDLLEEYENIIENTLYQIYNSEKTFKPK
jgi:hypothetical protein